jgi:hypothetical protein
MLPGFSESGPSGVGALTGTGFVVDMCDDHHDDDGDDDDNDGDDHDNDGDHHDKDGDHHDKNGDHTIRLETAKRLNDEIQLQRLRVFKATTRTVQDIVNNLLSSLQFVHLEAEGLPGGDADVGGSDD